VDALISSEKLLERLGREELELKRLGLVNHAAGVRTAITILIRETQTAKEPPAPLEPST
jgi:hypothetical protein